MEESSARSEPQGDPATADGALPGDHTHRPSAAASDESALVERLKYGGRDAYREAILRYSPKMLAAARAIVGPADAEDVVQDTWITVLDKVGQFEGRAALGTWLLRIVSNRAISHLRAHAREVSPSDRDDEPQSPWFDDSGRWRAPPTAWSAGSPEELLSADALQDCIDKHLQLMPEQQRLVVVMRDIQQQSYDEICNELRVSASNVRVLLHRGRLRLMTMVNGFQETGKC